MQLNSKVYDVLKALAQIWIPAAGTLYFALAGIWKLPAAEQVVGTVVAFDTFLGLILGISTASFNKNDANFDGTMLKTVNADGKTIYTLELNSDPATFAEKTEVLFKLSES